MYIIFTNNLPINSYQTIPYSVLGIDPKSNPTAAQLTALDCYTFVDNPVPTYEPRLHYPNEVWTVDGTTCTRTWELLANTDEEGAWQYIREIRNGLLFECDWTQIPDADLTISEKNAWHVYRHALRDITDDFETPQDVVFPEKPTSVTTQYPVYHIFEFLSRFTPEERDAGRVAAETDPIIADFIQMSMAVQTVDANDSDVQSGMAYLVTAGVLTEQRKLEILGW